MSQLSDTPAATTAPHTAAEPCETVTVVLHGTAHVLSPVAGETILEIAYRAGLRPPVSCLSGRCATCVAHVTQGRVAMHSNDALTEPEVAAGYVLTCQGYPTARTVTVVYED